MDKRQRIGYYGKRTGQTVFNAVMFVLAFINLFPLIWMGYSSLKTKQEYMRSVFSLPAKPQFSNYSDAIRVGKLLGGFANSLFISILSVLIIIVIAFVVGYCLARYRFPGRNFLYLFFISGMMIPMHALMVPVFLEFKFLNMLNNRFTLILPYMAFGLPMAIFLMEGFIRGLPIEIEEAACVDGSRFFNTLVRIVAPTCRPVLSTAIIMAFLDTWNEFSFALILVSDEHYKTLPLLLTGFSGQYTTDHTKLLAALTLATLPVLLLYFVLNKKIVEGMVAGAVKG